MALRGKQEAIAHVAIAGAALLGLVHGAGANPTGPQVAAGTASIQGLGTNNVKVTNSPGSIINWQSFSIGAGQTTQFVQQSASSAVLNRVVGADVSQIHGTLMSNGRVFLVNPSGMMFGAGSRVDTAAFVAATNMSNADFLGGNHGWSRQGSFLEVHGRFEVNQLTLTEAGISSMGINSGAITLKTAGTLDLQGGIDANGGDIILEAGMVNVAMGTQGAAGPVHIQNGGTTPSFAVISPNLMVRAQSGQITLVAPRNVTVNPGAITITPRVPITLPSNTAGSIVTTAVGIATRAVSAPAIVASGTTTTNGSVPGSGNVTLTSGTGSPGANIVTNASIPAGGATITLQKREPVF